MSRTNKSQRGSRSKHFYSAEEKSDAIRQTLRRTVEREQKRLKNRQLMFIVIAAMILFWLMVYFVTNF